MPLNHINLTVPEVARTREFFETYFGFRCIADRGPIAVLTDDAGFVLTLSNFERATSVEYPGAFHIGFIQESREKVDEIHARLKADGFDVEAPRQYHGSWTFYFKAPGGVTVEIQHMRMDFPEKSAAITRPV